MARDNGLPITTFAIASFHVGPPALPSKPGRLQLVRRGGDVVVDWSGANSTTAYTVSVELTDGRMFGLTPGRGCRGALLRAVAARWACRSR
jgi:hypothetical protein